MGLSVSKAVLIGVSSLPLWADFSYQETSQVTGGALAGMMKMASLVSREAGQPIQTAISVQGNRMVRTNSRRVEIIDLDQETITAIEPNKETYSVMTFAEMREAMERAMAKAQGKSETAPPSTGVKDVKMSLKETGETRELSGFPAKGWQMNLQMEVANEKGEKGTFVVTSDLFLAGKVAGYNEVKEFHRKMAEKLAFGLAGSGLAAMMGNAQSAQMAKGMEAFSKEAVKMDGLPLLTITRMGASPTGEPLAIAAPDTTPAPDVKKEAGRAATQGATDAAASAVLGRLGGLGGLGGGFGRKKKEQPAPAATTPEATPASGSPTDSGVLMQMETKLDGFSAAPVEASKFAVPAGFKQVDPEMKRHGR